MDGIKQAHYFFSAFRKKASLTVSKYMGHSDSTVTLKVYSHFIPDTQDRALNALAKLAV